MSARLKSIAQAGHGPLRLRRLMREAKLQLSDNFYYGASGIVFVYPLYELASYAEGMPELKLPYQMAKGLFKPEYLPNLPNYENK